MNEVESQLPPHDEDPASHSDETPESRPARSDERLLLIERLVEAREAHGWSQEDLSDRTRISLHVLAGLEAGDFEVVEPPYLRAFLRTYAKQVGVPIEEINTVFPEPKAPVEIAPEGEADHSIPIVPRSRIPLWFIVKTGLVVAVLAGIWWWGPWDRREPPARQAARVRAQPMDTARLVEQRADTLHAVAHPDTVVTTDTTVASSTLPEEPVLRPIAPPAFAPPAPQPREARARRLTIAATDTVWVRIMKPDSAIVYDAIMTPGIQRQWNVSDTVRVTVGRWWAMQMSLDGNAVPVPHGSRDATSFLCTPSGIARR